MKRIKLYSICVFLFVSGSVKVSAQVDTSFKKTRIVYLDYLGLVGKNNLRYAAEKFNVNIAEAAIETAKIFPDPQISYGYFNNGQRRMEMGYGFMSGLATTIELGGKRKARINLAESQNELAKYLLQDFFRGMRADATVNFLAALQNKYLLDVQLNSYETMRQLAASDSIRFKLGSITEIDSRQSKLEAGTMLNGVFQNEAGWKMSLLNLSLFLGRQKNDTLYSPIGDFAKFDRDFNLLQLITTAQNNRSDLLAALQSKNVSQKMLELAKANRVIDVNLNTNILYASYDRNVIAPTSSFSQFSGGISIPLKFSNKYAGELKTAYYANRQADLLYQQVELQIQTEVTQAYFNYIATRKQVEQFNNGLLTEAKKVLDGKIYSYKRGETSLLEVLNAQRTYNDVQQTYYQTLYNYGAALVELEKAAGIWDINF
ncbi:MAG TPA: TolC family protein [Bacteroidia bacterium]|jgi:cobalt-zinc-cadmium efflux system outer membrane protein|nr:TolC family protein [Bacteroidia bacterium]